MTSRKLTLLVDGACPLCRREGQWLRRLDRGRGRLEIVDISEASCDPGTYGLTMDDVMGQIHGVLPGGQVIKGMRVFRRAYDAVGLGWLLAPTNWPVLRPVCDAGYRWFARNRYRLTRRSDACETGSCRPR